METIALAHEELLRDRVSEKMQRRRASLTDCEAAFLSALLIDHTLAPVGDTPIKENSKGTKNNVKHLENASRVLDDDMLFTIPLSLVEDPLEDEKKDESSQLRSSLRRSARNDPKKESILRGLWQAYEEGFTLKKLLHLSDKSRQRQEEQDAQEADTNDIQDEKCDDDEEDDKEDQDAESVRSDEEVRHEKSTAHDGAGLDDDASDGSSLAEEDCGFDHYDAWQVLKDEYANDFGFDFSVDGSIPSLDDSEMEQHRFKILGTSADDISAQPHVLSPPLIDALLNFVPEHISGSNLWMKYSLVRDGASISTFKRYVRASDETFLAIETTKGQVFGCFTSSAWRTNYGFYGGNPAFVWRMRHNRNSPCHSLIEQAQLENEIDVYLLVGTENMVQCCTHNMIGIGEGKVNMGNPSDKRLSLNESAEPQEADDFENFGFAFALADDLLSGTSSSCSSFKNACLVDPSSHGETFEVLNLEVWTFTPCMTVDSAEKLEMTQFFVHESSRNASMRSNQSTGSSQFSSVDFDQDQFYRRVGYDDENEQERERWQYRSMMDGNNGTRAFGAAPRIASSGKEF